MTPLFYVGLVALLALIVDALLDKYYYRMEK